MKLLKTSLFIIALSLSSIMQAQTTENENTSTLDKESYYHKRAQEDAKYEQQFSAKTKKEEKQFWKDQKAYEKNLKKKDKEAYKAYIQGKKDAYAEHYNECNHHCHHSDHYYSHASFYYYRYNDNYYYRSPSRSSGVRVRVNTPSIRLGL